MSRRAILKELLHLKGCPISFDGFRPLSNLCPNETCPIHTRDMAYDGGIHQDCWYIIHAIGPRCELPVRGLDLADRNMLKAYRRKVAARKRSRKARRAGRKHRRAKA